MAYCKIRKIKQTGQQEYLLKLLIVQYKPFYYVFPQHIGCSYPELRGLKAVQPVSLCDDCIEVVNIHVPFHGSLPLLLNYSNFSNSSFHLKLNQVGQAGNVQQATAISLYRLRPQSCLPLVE